MKSHAEAFQRKEETLADLKNCMERSNIAILTDYRGVAKGLTVKQITDLRAKLRLVNGEYRVVKNTLAARVAKELGFNGLESHLEGPTAIAFGYDDPAAVTKTVLNFSNDNKATALPNVKVAYMEGQLLSPDQLKAIAELPSREALLGQILGLMLTIPRNLLGILNAEGRQMATVIDAWRQKLAESQPAQAAPQQAEAPAAEAAAPEAPAPEAAAPEAAAPEAPAAEASAPEAAAPEAEAQS